jgi:hypothetical protein
MNAIASGRLLSGILFSSSCIALLEGFSGQEYFFALLLVFNLLFEN